MNDDNGYSPWSTTSLYLDFGDEGRVESSRYVKIDVLPHLDACNFECGFPKVEFETVDIKALYLLRDFLNNCLPPSQNESQ